MEICMTSSSPKPRSVAMRVAFSSALSIVSSEESSVYETFCSVMAIDEVKQKYTTGKGRCVENPSAGARQMRFPANSVVCLSDAELSTTLDTDARKRGARQVSGMDKALRDWTCRPGPELDSSMSPARLRSEAKSTSQCSDPMSVQSGSPRDSFP